MSIPTTEKLAKALEAANDPKLDEMIVLALAGYYDDYKSELVNPIGQLVADLRELGHEALAQRAINGEFDGTPEESSAWFETRGKYLVPSKMLPMFGYTPNQRPKPKGFGG